MMPDHPATGFNVRNLAVLNYANGQTLWHYKAGDDLIAHTVADGYFNDAADMIRDGDILIIKGHDGTAFRVAGTPASHSIILSAPL